MNLVCILSIFVEELYILYKSPVIYCNSRVNRFKLLKHTNSVLGHSTFNIYNLVQSMINKYKECQNPKVHNKAN